MIDSNYLVKKASISGEFLFAYCFIASLGLGIVTGKYLFEPKAVYEIDVNEDKRKDIVIKNSKGHTVFLKKEDGSFINLESILTDEILQIGKKKEDINNKVKEELKN